MTEPEELKNLGEFLFGAPLYKSYELPSNSNILEFLYGREAEKVRIDGYCPYCSKDTTFVLRSRYFTDQNLLNLDNRIAYDNIAITCVRHDSHKIDYWFFINRLNIQKIGQFPSLADISSDEISQYRKGMSKEDAREFHKAIELAAHGVGVGSFVYLRRVFEHLITGRYEEFKVAEGWKDEEFQNLRMAEKIKFLKDHLPDFLVQNAEIYSILSSGIHDLDEKTCLGAFDLLKQSIIIILDEDKKKMEEMNPKTKLAGAIKKFGAQATSE